MRSRFAKVAFMLPIAVMLCSAGEKTASLPKELPPYGPDVPFRTVPVSEVKLPNGLTVWFAPIAGVPKVAISVVVKGGFSADGPNRQGLAELLANALPEGTKTRSAKQVADDILGYGGNLLTEADADSIKISTSVLSDKSDPALGLVADIVQNAAFADQEVQIVKQNAESNLETNESDPSFLAQRALHHALFGHHPYGTIGAGKEVIRSATATQLRQLFDSEFRPERTLLVAVGSFEPGTLRQSIEKHFANWQRGAQGTVTPMEEPTSAITKTAIIVPRPNSVQTGFMVGAVGPTVASPDFAAADVANAIYGGMFGSRLVKNIREDKGYTYSPHSRLETHQAGGLLFTQAQVRNDVTGPSFNEISYELNRIATTTPEVSEIESAKRYLSGRMICRLQDYDNLAGTLGNYWTYGLQAGDLKVTMDKIERASAKDIEAAGQKYFPVSKMTIVTVGDENIIRTQLAPFGLEFTHAQ